MEDASYTFCVREYAHHCELQRRWAWMALAPLLKQWKETDHVLDIE